MTLTKAIFGIILLLVLTPILLGCGIGGVIAVGALWVLFFRLCTTPGPIQAAASGEKYCTGCGHPVDRHDEHGCANLYGTPEACFCQRKRSSWLS